MADYSISEISASPIAEGARFTLGGATALAVRQANKDVAMRIRRGGHPVRQALAHIPFVRGMARFVFGIVDFIGGLAESADLEPQRIHRGTNIESGAARLLQLHPESLVSFGSGVLALLILAALLFALPLGAQAIIDRAALGLPRAGQNAIMCAVRVVGLLAALAILPRLRVLRRLSMYRGAIHKVINAYQSTGGHVSVEKAEEAFCISPRCDMAFITLVLCLSLIGYSLALTYTLWVQLLVRLLIPLAIAAVVNEPIQALEDMDPEDPAAPLIEPMLWLERLFAFEPHKQMVEVAVFAFNAARENDTDE